jgi:Glycosyl hydrolases family 39
MRTVKRSTPLLAFVVISVFIQADAVAQMYRLHPPATTVPATLFGLHIHHAAATTPWPSIPFGTWRLWDANVVWANLEPQKGKWDFRTLDKYVSLAEREHVQILMPLGMPPPWASERPKESPTFRPGSAAPPKNMADWDNYVRTLATRYKGQIQSWELWNEPNSEAFYTGSIPQLVALAKAAYTILKQVDPSNELVSPSATYGYKGTSWLDDYLKAGGGNYADIIGYHFYVMSEGPEAMVPLIERVKQVMAQDDAGNKPLWNTETGWYIQSGKAGANPSGARQAGLLPNPAQGYVARAYILSWAAGVSRLYWYDWDSPTMGLTEPGAKLRKPAGYAYWVTEKWLIGAQMTSCDSDSSGTWVCHIIRDGGYNGYVLWNAGGEKSFAIPQAWNVQNYQGINGNMHALKDPKSIRVGPLPILLENKLP